MIQIPSIYSLWHSTRSVVGRFTIPFLISLFAVVIWLVAIDSPAHLQSTYYKWLALSNIAFCVTLSIDLYKESRSVTPLWCWSMRILTIGLCILLFFALVPQWKETDVYRFLLFILAAHLLVSVAPFSHRQQVHGFWQYNKFLFLRILITGLYSGVLYAGLAIALLCIEQLFALQINGDVYFRMFAIIAAGFNTVFFLAGFPTDIKTFEADTQYPKGLKIFTQYVLIPLLAIYLAILVVYEIKIVWQQHLPEGTVSILILGYAVLGILSYLLIYPIRIQPGNEWMKTFSKLFFLWMIPLLLLLFVAVWVRIANYAMTEPRYFLIILALWLSAITFYFIAAKAPRIQLIPISLCALALLATFGPQSAASVARTSQLNRYIDLQHSNIDTAQDEKAAIIRYLVGNHGFESLQRLTSENLDSLKSSIVATKRGRGDTRYQLKTALIDTAFSILNVDPKFQNRYAPPYLNLVLQEQMVSIRDYAYMAELSSYSRIEPDTAALFPIEVTPVADEQYIAVKVGSSDSIRFDVKAFSNAMRGKIKRKDYATLNNEQTLRIPEEDFRWTGSTERYEVAIIFKSLNLPELESADRNQRHINFSAVLLLRRKHEKDKNDTLL